MLLHENWSNKTEDFAKTGKAMKVADLTDLC